MSADTGYGVSGWEVRTAKSSAFAGLFRWFALPVLANGITVETGHYFDGTGYVTRDRCPRIRYGGSTPSWIEIAQSLKTRRSR